MNPIKSHFHTHQFTNLVFIKVTLKPQSQFCDPLIRLPAALWTVHYSLLLGAFLPLASGLPTSDLPITAPLTASQFYCWNVWFPQHSPSQCPGTPSSGFLSFVTTCVYFCSLPQHWGTTGNLFLLPLGIFTCMFHWHLRPNFSKTEHFICTNILAVIILVQ